VNKTRNEKSGLRNNIMVNESRNVARNLPTNIGVNESKSFHIAYKIMLGTTNKEKQ